MKQKRIRDYNIQIGQLPCGALNKISDVPGVTVGHSTVDNDRNKTGVTVIKPSEDNIFLNKLRAACHIINGYGKTSGLIQIEELGQLESPIALTNTLNVGKVQDALIGHMLGTTKAKGTVIRSINTVVAECNDSYLNQIGDRAVEAQHVFEAVDSACEDFQEGAVGGGKGMSCYQLKGGIGSASRLIEYDDEVYTIGVLVQTNFGLLKDLLINGKQAGREISSIYSAEDEKDEGSMITVIATDLPLTSRQLKRICKRAVVGVARTGGHIGHGSGEVVIAFSTANVMKEKEETCFTNFRYIRDNHLDKAFTAVIESTEEAILNSMITSERIEGIDGHVREGLAEFIDSI